MNIDDPNAWAQGAAAFKGIFDGLRSAIGMVRDLRASGTTGPAEQQLVDEALAKAERASKIAEAELAKALGYQLCKCEFPPTPMLTVGFLGRGPKEMMGPVYQCPKCGSDTAGPYGFERTRDLR